MSHEKNSEVGGREASIMMNVWSIREREYVQKIQHEEERIGKSAMTSINQDWANRVAAKNGQNRKRVERKPKPVENKVENTKVWKRKEPQVPPTLPHGTGSGPFGRPGGQSRPAGQSRGFSTPASHSKDKKGQDKSLQKLQLLMSITQTQPSSMVWGKSWKYNKSLPLPAEGTEAILAWGQCWMFATQQPYSEPGQPWLNGPNMVNPNTLHLWKKMSSRVVESQELDLSLPTEEWQMSWRKSVKNNKEKASSGNEENDPKSRFFTLLETQHHNEALCSSEWSESWMSTKPASEQDDSTVPNDQMEDKEISSVWENCWKLVNQHGCNKSTLPKMKKLHSPEWADSWRAAIVVKNNKNSNSSLKQDISDMCDDHIQQNELHHHKVMLGSREQKHKDLYMKLSNEFEALPEWSKSWQVTKNNSKPSEEIEKILKASPQQMETALEAEKVEKTPKEHYATSEKVDPRYEQLKHDVIYCPKREFTQSKLLHLKHLQNVMSVPEWTGSWKTLKHRMRMERRRMRPDPSRPFRGSENREDMKPSVTEWKESWKFTCPTVHQEPELWQQGWATVPQIRVARMRDQGHFVPVELPRNGPTAERSWEESWRFSRPQHRSQPGQQGRSSHHPDESWAPRRNARSVSDWQVSWMVSETQFHHDRPSFTQWREAWRSSGFYTEPSTERVPREHSVEELMEFQPRRERMSWQVAKARMSQSFDKQIFRERYPEKEWNASWKAGSLPNHQSSHDVSGKSMSSTNQQQNATTNGHRSRWGMSFRLANPMPKMEQPWLESSPSNPSHYPVMWSREKKIQSNINTNFINNPATFKLWVKSHLFLQTGNVQIKDNTMSKKVVDPRVIVSRKSKPRKHLYSNIEQEKAKKWPGCHLLGKTQPRPKKGPVQKLKTEVKDTMFEEWAESWRFSAQPGGLTKPVKSLSGWVESWKFLIPPYQTMNGPKAK